MPVTLLADTLAIVAGYLRQHDDVRSITTRVYTQPPPSVVTPYVRLRQIMESELVARRFAATRVQVEAYAASDEAARDLAATCRAVLHDLPGWSHPQGWVSHVEEASGVSPVPDTASESERWLFDVRVYAAPH